MSAEPEPEPEPEPAADTCYRWCRDFVVAHAIFASGFVTAPVAVLLLIHRPRSGHAIFFAAFAAFCTTISLILCCRFYAELRRPPCPHWLSAGQQQQEEDEDVTVVVGQETTAAREVSSHVLRHPEHTVLACVEMQAALATGRVPCYEHPDDDGAAEDCAVCLGEVGKGEMARRLPACQHVFHRECIDLWLRAHVTCPVCRSGVLPALPEPERRAEVVVDVGAVHGQPRAAILAPPGIVFSGRTGSRLWYGPVPISRLG